MYISSYRTDWIHISTVLSAPIGKIIKRTINELDEGDTIKDVCLVVSFNCFRTETPNKYHVAWRVFKTTMRRPNGEIHQLNSQIKCIVSEAKLSTVSEQMMFNDELSHLRGDPFYSLEIISPFLFDYHLNYECLMSSIKINQVCVCFYFQLKMCRWRELHWKEFIEAHNSYRNEWKEWRNHR